MLEKKKKENTKTKQGRNRQTDRHYFHKGGEKNRGRRRQYICNRELAQSGYTWETQLGNITWLTRQRKQN